MTREEAIEYWEGLRKTFSSQLEKEENHFGRMHLQTTIDAIDMAISALRQQEHFREVTKKVEPLTLDELRQMDGEPIWCVSLGANLSRGNGWYIGVNNWCLNGYGKTWLAYRQKTEDV